MVFLTNTGQTIATFQLSTQAAQGDVYLWGVQGQTYTLYQNQSLGGAYTDTTNTLTAGTLAFGCFDDGSTLAHCQFGYFIGGNYVKSAQRLNPTRMNRKRNGGTNFGLNILEWF
jgi:hypothetical protein